MQCLEVLPNLGWVDCIPHGKCRSVRNKFQRLCSRCEVPTGELESNTKVYPVRDYARYQPFKCGHWIAETDNHITPPNLGISFG